MNLRCFLLILVVVSLIAVFPLAGQVKITQLADRISVNIDGKPYTDFFLAPGGNKPYVWPLSTAAGILVTRRFPMEKVEGEQTDHPHHRGLFFSHGEVNGINFWATETILEESERRPDGAEEGAGGQERREVRDDQGRF